MPASGRSPATRVPAAGPSRAAGPVSGNDALRREIIRYLESRHVMTIASCRKNVPWASAVYYASDGLELYFFSKPTSRHGMNMKENVRVSAAIHEDYSDWKQIQGIQLEGQAARLTSLRQKAQFWKIYEKKFPFIKQFLGQFLRPSAMRQAVKAKLEGVRLYRIVPHTLWFIDNSKGFGHREMLEAGGKQISPAATARTRRPSSDSSGRRR